MKNNTRIHILFLAFAGFILFNTSLKAQEPDAKQIDDTFRIVKRYEPTLVKANKISDYPSIVDTQKIELDFDYKFVEKQLDPEYKVDSIKAAKIKGEPLVKLYRGYAIVGFGNNTSPLGELYYNNLRSKRNSWGVHLKHFSSNGISSIENSDFRHNNFNLYGKKFTKKNVLTGGAEYNIHKMNYFGVPQDASPFSLSQGYGTFGLRGSIANITTDSSDVNFKAGLAFHNHSDQFDAKENNLLITSSFKTRLDNGLLGTLMLDIDNNGYDSKIVDSSIAQSTTIVKIHPRLDAGNEKWQLTGGPAFFLEAGDVNSFVLRAIGEFKANLIEEILIPYAGVKGGIQRNSYRGISDNNPFVASSINLVNSDNVLEIYGGFRGSFSSKISFNVSAGNSQMKSAPFFVKSRLNGSQPRVSFDVVYDDLSTTTLRGELAYQNKEKIKLFLIGEYYSFTTDQLAEAWHMPNYRVTINGLYDLRDKIIAKLDVFIIGSQKVLEIEDVTQGGNVQAEVNSTKTLKGTIDANIGLEYRYTKKVAAFLNFNNIASIQYERWQDYPTQRFNVMGGLKFSF